MCTFNGHKRFQPVHWLANGVVVDYLRMQKHTCKHRYRQTDRQTDTRVRLCRILASTWSGQGRRGAGQPHHCTIKYQCFCTHAHPTEHYVRMHIPINSKSNLHITTNYLNMYMFVGTYCVQYIRTHYRSQAAWVGGCIPPCRLI